MSELTTKLEQLRELQQELHARFEALTAELSETKKEVTDMETRALKAEATRDAAYAENARLRDRNKKLKEDRKILSAQVKNLTAMFDAALDMLPASQGVLRKQMEKRRARIAGGG